MLSRNPTWPRKTHSTIQTQRRRCRRTTTSIGAIWKTICSKRRKRPRSASPFSLVRSTAQTIQYTVEGGRAGLGEYHCHSGKSPFFRKRHRKSQPLPSLSDKRNTFRHFTKPRCFLGSSHTPSTRCGVDTSRRR